MPRRSDSSAPPSRVTLFLLLAIYLSFACVYSAVITLNQAPDEPWHYIYVLSLARGHFPEPSFEPPTGPPPPLHSKAPLPPTHQAQHPPLYYLLASLLSRAFGGFLSPQAAEHAVRILSILFGLATVLITHRLATAVFRGRHWTALTVTAMVSCLPLFQYQSAVVNNDALTILLFAALMWRTWLLLTREPRPLDWVIVGALLGAGALTKEIALVGVLVVLILTYIQVKRGRWPGPATARGVIIALALAAVIFAWWPIRNKMTYGVAFLHTTQSITPAHLLGSFMLRPATALDYIGSTLWTTTKLSFLSFWAPWWIVREYVSATLYGLLLLAFVTGAIAGHLLPGKRETPRSEGPAPAWLLPLWFAASALAVYVYALMVDPSAVAGGRYFLPVAPLIAIFLASGLHCLFARREKTVALSLIALLVALSAAALATTAHFYLSGRYLGQ